MLSGARGAAPTIFVSIAAYRDPQLEPTVEDCVAKAAHPEALRFGICWQRDASDPRLSFAADDRIRLLEYDWSESRGIGWARSKCMSLFDDEDFYLQLDSHHRFVEGWDEKLLSYAEMTGSSKPILTAHARNLDLSKPEVMPLALPRVVFGRWDGHIPHFRPGITPVTEQVARPMRARSISGHFCFTIGDFVCEVPCDPEIYYYGGAEITTAVRAFTSGYDLFHPPEPILSHAYANSRSDRKTHWADQRAEWRRRSRRSKARIAEFLTNPHTGAYGCGVARTVADYEAYAGLSFRHCRAQEYTHLNKEPPNPACADGWAEEPHEWNVRLQVRRAALPAGFAEADVWRVNLTDALGGAVHGEMLDAREISFLLSRPRPEPGFDMSFLSEREPAKWSLRAYRADDALGKVDGFVGRASSYGRAAIRL